MPQSVYENDDGFITDNEPQPDPLSEGVSAVFACNRVTQDERLADYRDGYENHSWAVRPYTLDRFERREQLGELSCLLCGRHFMVGEHTVCSGHFYFDPPFGGDEQELPPLYNLFRGYEMDTLLPKMFGCDLPEDGRITVRTEILMRYSVWVDPVCLGCLNGEPANEDKRRDRLNILMKTAMYHTLKAQVKLLEERFKSDQ